MMTNRTFILLCCLFLLSSAKIYNNYFTLSQIRRQKGWIYLDRMAFDQGLASAYLQIRIQTQTHAKNDPIALQLAFISDQSWNQEQAFKCDLKTQDNNFFGIRISLQKIKSYYSIYYQQFQVDKPKTYHFVLKDCDRLLANQYFRRQTKLYVNLQIMNGSNQHGSDQHMNKFMLPLLLILTAIMAYFSKGPKHNEIGQQRDWAKLVLYITLILNFIALLFNYIGFLIYLSGGRFYGFFDFMYLCFHSISESVLTSLIIFIAYGWTLTFTKDAQFDLYIPLVSMLGIINLILTLLGKINDGDSDKYHMYDTIPSYLLVFFRVLTMIIFTIGVIKVYFETQKNKQLVGFLTNFAFIGCVYFLSMPAIMILVTFLPKSQRKQIVFFSVQFIKNGINLILTWMISSKRSKYKKLRLQGQSFFQSGNKLL